MKAFLTIALLSIANVFMTFAWYGNLKLTEMKVITSKTPIILIILGSWAVALIEYCFMIPANRMGFNGNGGPFSLMQLKVIQEAITLIVFVGFSALLFKNESLHWNHAAALLLLVGAVYLVFMNK